jgi:hypothetical protein
VTRPILCVLDGAKALKTAAKAVFAHPVIARCQLHMTAGHGLPRPVRPEPTTTPARPPRPLPRGFAPAPSPPPT